MLLLLTILIKKFNSVRIFTKLPIGYNLWHSVLFISVSEYADDDDDENLPADPDDGEEDAEGVEEDEDDDEDEADSDDED